MDELTTPKDIEMPIRKAFAVFDTDRSGTLSANELKAVLQHPAGRVFGAKPFTAIVVQELIAKFDSNGDGVLDIEEFVMAFSSISASMSPKAKAAAEQRRLSVKLATAVASGESKCEHEWMKSDWPSHLGSSHYVAVCTKCGLDQQMPTPR
jgi:hypothetical protein